MNCQAEIEEVNSKNWVKKIYEQDIQNRWDSVYKKMQQSLIEGR